MLNGLFLLRLSLELMRRAVCNNLEDLNSLLEQVAIFGKGVQSMMLRPENAPGLNQCSTLS
jgi:hypothetical protein